MISSKMSKKNAGSVIRMNDTEKIEEFEALPLKFAYQFLAQKGFENEANEIRQSKDRYKSYSSTLRRGKVIELLEKNSMLEEFIEKYWSHGKTEDGKRRIRRYKTVYNSFLSADVGEEESEEERIEETSFAYEQDLKDYLSKSLPVIEPGLKLFKDENGVEGIEYPIDTENRRIDILAVDKNGVPVIIELKVSRGYEKVIGQCLYYKNKVKQLTNSTRVRIIIIAREITPQLNIATQDLPDVELFEYKLSVKLARVK
jgi:hypothetical protein